MSLQNFATALNDACASKNGENLPPTLTPCWYLFKPLVRHSYLEEVQRLKCRETGNGIITAMTC